jgi:hypothetical protein
MRVSGRGSALVAADSSLVYSDISMPPDKAVRCTQCVLCCSMRTLSVQCVTACMHTYMQMQCTQPMHACCNTELHTYIQMM